MAPVVYGREFYEEIGPGAIRSAQTIVPIILAHVPVRSAVDIGCGVGAWLHVLEQHNVRDIVGYDGDYIDRAMLLIDPANFRNIDLTDDFEIDRTFDLAVSLEVAEHLPHHLARPLVERLVSAAPFVLFSAAVPGQIGRHHMNEQWQEYWRAIFKEFSYSAVDLIRPRVWGRADVEYWYQQNVILYCKNEVLLTNHHLSPVPDNLSLNMVHEETYAMKLRVIDRLSDQQKCMKQIEQGERPVRWYIKLCTNALRVKMRQRLSLRNADS